MIHYLLIRADGSVAQRGLCPSKGEIPVIPGCTPQVIDESDTRRPKSAPDPTYQDLRRMEYPGIGDQLDAIWKSIEASSLPLSSEADAMLSRIKAIKLAHPKT